MRNIATLKLLIKRALNFRVPGKYSRVRKNDIFLVSYPKSGNTWLRFIIGNLISEKEVDFNNFNNIIPDMHQTLKKKLDKYQSPRIIKSHLSYTKSYPKVIYIYRDPRDVVISYYYWHKKYDKNFNLTIEQYIEKFIQGKNSIYGSWQQHYYSWVNSPLNERNKLLILKYEDIKANEFSEVHKIVDFLSLNVNRQEIEKAIENSKFDKMQNLEKKQTSTSEYLKNSRHDIRFVRSGKSQWRDYFTSDLTKKFKSKFGDTLIELDYESDFNW